MGDRGRRENGWRGWERDGGWLKEGRKVDVGKMVGRRKREGENRGWGGDTTDG